MKTVLTVLLFFGFAAFSANLKSESLRGKSPLKSVAIGNPLPDFTLSRPSGEKVALSEVVRENKLVLINFWASWCGPCRVEMPGFEKLYTARNREGFTILAVNEDEKRPQMDAFLQKKPVSFPVLLDDNSGLMRRFGVRSLPTTILVGGDGKVRGVYEGMQSLDAHVEAELKAKPSK
jgi:peroxiredoxin